MLILFILWIRWIQPVYLSSALMTSYVGLKFMIQKSLVKTCPEPYNTLTLMLCTGANLGLQLWVSFVSGTTMMRILPRHQVGEVQRSLFPKYTFLTSLFTFGSLSSFLNMKPSNSWTNDTLTMVKKSERKKKFILKIIIGCVLITFQIWP